MKDKKHILIVDDEKLVRSVVAKIAEKRGAEVTSLSNGKELKKILQDEIFHLAIVDLLMPEISGWGIIDTIRSDARNSKMPIVVLSGTKVSQEEKSRLLEKVNAVVNKSTFSLQGFDCIVESCSTL